MFLCMNIIMYMFHVIFTITSNSITVQLKSSIAFTNETSISIYTYLGATICSVTTPINIWMKQVSICVCVYLYLHCTCMNGHLYICTYHCMYSHQSPVEIQYYIHKYSFQYCLYMFGNNCVFHHYTH